MFIICTRYQPLIKLLEEIQDWFHGPQDWEHKSIIMTSGAQEGLSMAVNMCMSYGDPVIMPDPVYTGAIDLVRYTTYLQNKIFKKFRSNLKYSTTHLRFKTIFSNLRKKYISIIYTYILLIYTCILLSK